MYVDLYCGKCGGGRESSKVDSDYICAESDGCFGLEVFSLGFLEWDQACNCSPQGSARLSLFKSTNINKSGIKILFLAIGIVRSLRTGQALAGCIFSLMNPLRK